MARDGVQASRLTIVRNGPARLRHRASEPRKNGPILFGFAGVIGHQDSLDSLCRSLQYLRTNLGREDFKCLLVGDGGALPEIRAYAVELGLQEHMQFLGWISDVEKYFEILESTDICVSPEQANPYNERSTFVKVTEYMSVGKPIVAYDLPETRFTAGNAAVYAPKNREDVFAELLSQLMDDPAKREQMGEAGRLRTT